MVADPFEGWRWDYEFSAAQARRESTRIS